MKAIVFLILFASLSPPAFVESDPELPCEPVIGDEGHCAPACYCIPDDPGRCNACPGVGNRQFAYLSGSSEVFFAGLEVEEASVFRLDPAGCNPFPAVASVLNQTLCSGVTTAGKGGGTETKTKVVGDDGNGDIANGPVRCVFEYKRSKKGKSEGDRRRYSILEEPAPFKTTKKKSKKSPKAAKRDTVLTHIGSCGVCSSAQDLVVNLSPTLDVDALSCTTKASEELLADATVETAFAGLVGCFDAVGFSRDCSVLWSSHALNTILALVAAYQSSNGGTAFVGPQSCTECAETCVTDPSSPVCSWWLSPDTCEPSPCVACDEAVSGPAFEAYGGRTRRNSGIVTTFPDIPGFEGTKRLCSTIADIGQALP